MDIQSPIIVTNLTLSGSVALTPESQASLVGQLTGSLDQNYILSGSLTQTTWENLSGKPEGIVSESAQVSLADITGRSFADDTYTFPNKVILSGSALVQRAEEKITISATAATGTINFDVLTQPLVYYTSNASGDWTLNLRGNASTTLNNSMEVGRALTVVFMVTNGATPYRQTGFQIDGSNVTPKWIGGLAPTAGNANSVDSYTIAVMKTGNATFTVFESQNKFA